MTRMTVHQLFPVNELLSIDDWMLRVRSAPGVRPFDSTLINICCLLSKAFLRDPQARRYPELQALGFQLRRSQLECLRKEFETSISPDTVSVPRGLVFHIPPGNVEPVMVYSWIYSLLCGNRSIIRLSAKRSESMSIILRLIGEIDATLAGAIGSCTSIIEYGHEISITSRISQECDLRVIWGGDETINTIRKCPLQPRGRDITFADRSSLCMVSADAYLNAPAARRAAVVSGFFTDTYTFNQLACSSPRALIWQGIERRCLEASTLFIEGLRNAISRRGHESPLSMAMSGFLLGCTAVIDNDSSFYTRYDNKLSVIHQSSPGDTPEQHCGGGVLFQAFVRDIHDLVQYVRPQHQTLTCFGFAAEDLRELALAINGRGIDRMVPIGQALTFDRCWDGYDLLREMTKLVHVPRETAGTGRFSPVPAALLEPAGNSANGL